MQFIDPREFFAQQDRLQMLQEAQRLEVERFFVEISPEHLATFRLMMYSIIALKDQGLPLAAYYEGMAAQTLVLKHQVCGGCGEQHDENDPRHGQDAASDPGKESKPDPMEQSGPMGEESFFAKPDESSQTFGDVYVDISRELIGQTGILPTEVQEKMVEYDLDDLRDDETGAILGFICNNCQMKYVSIADRALRQPGVEGCEGCINKAKWG